MQITLTALILMLCFFYAGRRLYRVFKQHEDPCSGCDGCDLKERYAEKQGCDKKK